MAKTKTRPYLPDETALMAKAGYVTARAAAEAAKVRTDRVYRAIIAKQVRVKLGTNGYTRYVNRADWLKLIGAARDRVMQGLGLR